MILNDNVADCVVFTRNFISNGFIEQDETGVVDNDDTDIYVFSFSDELHFWYDVKSECILSWVTYSYRWRYFR